MARKDATPSGCNSSRFAGVTAGVLQLMAAILTIGSLNARWAAIDDSSDNVVMWVHIKGVTGHLDGPTVTYTWDEAATCSGDDTTFCDSAASAKTAFEAAMWILSFSCAIDVLLWFMGDVAWKFQEMPSVTRNGRRRTIGWAVFAASLALAVIRIAFLIALWSRGNTLMKDQLTALNDPDGYTSGSFQTAEGIMFMALFFNFFALALDLRALMRHKVEEKARATTTMLEAGVAYQLHA